METKEGIPLREALEAIRDIVDHQLPAYAYSGDEAASRLAALCDDAFQIADAALTAPLGEDQFLTPTKSGEEEK